MLDLSNNITERDLERRHDIVNHSPYADGFDNSGGSDEGMLDDMGFDMSDLFDDGTSGGGSGSNSFDSLGFGGFSGFGGTPNMSGGQSLVGGQSNLFGGPNMGNNPFMNNGQQQMQNQPKQKDFIDVLMETGADTAKDVGHILMDMLKSIKERSVDDIGYLSRNLILTGASLLGASLLLGITGIIADIDFIKFSGFSLQLMLCGGFTASFGMVGIGTSAFVLAGKGDSDAGSFSDIPDVVSNDNFTDSYEDNLGDELDELFGMDFDLESESTDNIFGNVSESDQEPEPEDDVFSSEPEDLNIDWDAAIKEVQENKYINRENLFSTFVPMFPPCTPKFALSKELDSGSKDFAALEIKCLKALALILNCTMEEVDTNLVSATENFFSYTLLLKRISKVKNYEAFAEELEIQLRSDSNDLSVNVTVYPEGDNYKIIITKGVEAIVSFGDVFKQQDVRDFFLDQKIKLPMITGIDELGNVILEDARNFDTMMITGKPRSGKSWYVLSILACLILFNSPEMVQMLIVDPKKSSLFKTLALMPHVFGLHDDKKILSILSDIIEVEAPRRKKILADHKCDDIWALHKKGVTLPILYIVIDEYLTVHGNLDSDQQKEFDTKIKIIISQLPSQGIRLIFIPHRATSVVSKTNRTMLQFTAAVRADTEEVNETLGIKGWKRSLTKPGDIALKSASMQVAKYVRGAALTMDDENNTKFIETAAKAFYKMGVDLPDMSMLRIACNRDEEAIQSELGGSSTRIQYNSDSEHSSNGSIDYKGVLETLDNDDIDFDSL